MTSLILGTRGSELALTQARMTAAALRAAWPDLTVEQQIIKTAGDLRPDLKLSEFSQGEHPVTDKGIFTKELEIALRAGTIHAAVHSLKDVPTVLDPGFRISAALPRAAVEDVLVSKHAGGLEALPPGATVATSSVRRARLLRHLRPDLKVTDIRGNVPTRLRKAADSPEIDALLLARAGLERLGLYRPVLEDYGAALHMTELDSSRFLPAASQGAVALETYNESPELARLLAAINDPETLLRVTAERRFLELLEAGCQTPVGVHTRVENGVMFLKALVFPDHGDSPPRAAEARADAADPAKAGEALFAALG